MMRRVKKNSGQGTTELALLLPILFLMFFGAVQIIIFLQSSTMTQYASFVSARAFQVYGDRNLNSINYPKVASLPHTNEGQTIAEAAAEAVIFESLMWEHRRVKVLDQANYLRRVYEDGNNTMHNGGFSQSSTGVVQVNFLCGSSQGCDLGTGVEVQYCMPIVFPGIDNFFSAVKGESPCTVTQNGRTYSGVAITSKTQFGREPVEQ
ncbi:MAG: pilus assembly protein [Proteobacteria bacterium]|jgi:hypothetical protein|nr:pilus assembly protein [Pseudomonadota bacterium]